MKVRCGACRTEFDAATEGRHACPTCGAVNEVSSMPPPHESAVPPPMMASPTSASPPAGAEVTPPPSTLAKVVCDQCSFEFVVGDIEVATCPNCSAEVKM